MSRIVTLWLKWYLRFSLALAIALGLVFGGSTWALANEKSIPIETVKIGPYTAMLQLSDVSPHVERPLQVMLLLSEKGRFSGRLVAYPGLGINAVPVHANLLPDQRVSNALRGAIHLPVRGQWHLLIGLDGPRGRGATSMDLTVSAPDALPIWLGWLIGLSPLVGCAWLACHQWRYRRKLLLEKLFFAQC
jgi:hypothetical protein